MTLSEIFARKIEEWTAALEKRAAHIDTLILHRDIFNIALMDCALEKTPEEIARRQEKSTAPPAEAEKIKSTMAGMRERIKTRTVNDSAFRAEFNRYAGAVKALVPVAVVPPDANIFDKARLAWRRLLLQPQRVTFMAAEQNLYDALYPE